MKEYHVVLVQKDLGGEKRLPCYARVNYSADVFQVCKPYHGMYFESVYITESPADALAIYDKLEKDFQNRGIHKLGNIVL